MSLKGWAARARSLWQLYRLCDGLGQVQVFRRLRDAGRAGEPPVEIRLRALSGRPLWVRPGTTDLEVLWDTFVRQYHLPPAEAPPPRLILDLGANVGYTAAHLAALHPRARVLAVELDQANAELARRNLAAFGDRCQVLHAAVWSREGKVVYQGDEEWGYRVAVAPGGPAGRGEAAAVTMEGLLRSLGGERVGYLKMDVEGAEAELFRTGADWLSRVDSLRVELHPENDPRADYAELAPVVRAAGLSCRPCRLHPRCLVGSR
jgi:FkbM family methyltransferase